MLLPPSGLKNKASKKIVGLHFNSEDGGDLFLPKIGWLSVD
jgi:hypothetical protein